MKKHIRKYLCALLAVLCVFTFALTGCGWDGGSGSANNPPESTSDKNPSSEKPGDVAVDNPIRVDPLDLGADFNSDYYPKKENIEQRTGKIDVVIVFEGTKVGWQALANEYMRLHSKAVSVRLDTNYSSGTYSDALKYEITNAKTDWDIVQGNIVSNLISQYCVNMYTYVNGKNGYAGNKVWSNVIEEDAYITDKSGTNTTTYIMNTESLLTAWFVNKVALAAAGEKGYVNAEGKVENPVTWDDLINLCKYMKEAGYENPLGIPLSSNDIQNFNFSWLLRVYGDYYFRNEYDGSMYSSRNFEYDPTSENPEGDIEFGIDPTRMFNKILDETSEKYIGAKSTKFKEFVSQFEKMSPYINKTDATQTSMEDMRNAFQKQTKGKASPQIVLDYSGTGLAFLKSQNENLQVDFFDYPAMVSKGGYIPEGTIVRDVGGNGGFLSIINHDTKQNALNLDFMKFVMSPYGQSIYYDALSKTDYTPQALTLVKQNLVKVPAEWAEFFKTDKIKFSGYVDGNDYLKHLVMSMGGMGATKVRNVNVELYQKLLAGQGSDEITVDIFSERWAAALKSGWIDYAKKNNWNETCYMRPGTDPKSGPAE